MTKNLQRAAGKMPRGQELKEKKCNLVPVIVAEHNLVSNVSTSQVAEELAKEDERSDLSLDEDCEVGEGRGEEVTTSQSSASMQVLANVVVSCSHVLSLNYYCHFLRILIVPCLHLIALPICGSMMRRRRKRRLGWSMALLPSVNQVLRGLANSFESKVGDSCNHRSKEENSDDSDLNPGSSYDDSQR